MISQVIVAGRILGVNSGTVSFLLSAPITDNLGLNVPADVINVEMSNGIFFVSLFATTESTTRPIGTFYTVTAVAGTTTATATFTLPPTPSRTQLSTLVELPHFTILYEPIPPDSSTAVPITTVTSLGDLIIGTGANSVGRVGIGSTGQVLTVLAGVPTWLTPGGGGGGSPPVNSVLPIISGTTTVGNVLTAANGTWSGASSYAYQWVRGATVISGEITSTYTLQIVDIGAVITVRVTATNDFGSAQVTSSGTAAISPSGVAPVNSAVPIITGTAMVGDDLAASNGTWLDTPTAYAFAWFRDGVAISGATANTYLLVTADQGNVITVTVTASNTTGSTPATSAPTSTVAPGLTAPVFTAQSPPGGSVGTPYTYTFVATETPTYAPGVSIPVDSTVPVITGTPVVGNVLTSSTGTWNATVDTLPTGLTLSTNGVLSGTPTAPGTLTFTVVATNSAGSTTSSSCVVTIAALAGDPVFSADSPPAGVVGTAYSYTFVATNSPVYTYTGTLPAGLTLTSGVLAGTPTAVATSTFVVTATNSTGSASTGTLSVAVTAAVTIPTNTALPVITGTPIVGDVLTISNGSWS